MVGKRNGLCAWLHAGDHGEMKNTHILWTLFVRMLGISAFVLGGGFAIIAVADEVFSKKLKWTQEGEILGQLSVFQMVPGMICTNTAIYVGNKVAGPVGAAVALIGTVLPSLVIFSAITIGYGVIPVENPYLSAAFSGLRASLAGIVFALVVRGWKKNIRGVYGYLMLVVSVGLLCSGRVAAATMIGIAALAGVMIESVKRARSSGRLVFQSSFWVLPLLFLKYGALAFGGGYVLVPMYFEDFVGPTAPYLQIAAEEFANVMALTQMTPGSISVNCATFFGYRMYGPVGSIVATLAMVLPNYCLLLLVLKFLERFKSSLLVSGLLEGIRPVTVALMVSAAWAFAGMSIWGGISTDGHTVRPPEALIAGVTLVAMLIRRLSVVQLVFGSALVSVIAKMIFH